MIEYINKEELGASSSSKFQVGEKPTQKAKQKQVVG